MPLQDLSLHGFATEQALNVAELALKFASVVGNDHVAIRLGCSQAAVGGATLHPNGRPGEMPWSWAPAETAMPG